MNTNLLLSLEITALGMGLVFGAIILLWGTMAFLTAVTAEKESASDSPEVDSATPSIALTPVPSPSGRGELERIALLAVAMALAEQGQSSAHPLEQPPTALVSAWQLGMRTRQMAEKGHPKRG
jgi:Na+-transporting methylmalonyl-CoA/oxaloacetate decarboxylase gamma subunit